MVKQVVLKRALAPLSISAAPSLHTFSEGLTWGDFSLLRLPALDVSAVL